jgi:simple sugar transport system ATP-binding protein
MVNSGLSIMFISHKLNEILEISDRIVVLRHGKLVGEVATKKANKELLAEMMVGHKVTRPAYEKLEIGKAVVELNNVCLNASDGSLGLSNINLKIHEKEIIGLAGVSGNGQFGLASILQGLTHPSSGEFKLFGQSLIKYDPRYLTKSGVARIPEDRSKEGVIGEMALWENFLGEELRSKAKSGFIIDKKKAVNNAEKLIKEYDIRCEGAFASTRLLSGGNIQKLILARSLSNNPRFIIANKPARGLDEGAISFVQHQIINAKTKGAGVLLISEDLDEIFELSDRIAVIFDGKLQGPFDASSLTINQVGLMMSGEMKEGSFNEA